MFQKLGEYEFSYSQKKSENEMNKMKWGELYEEKEHRSGRAHPCSRKSTFRRRVVNSV